MASDTASKIRRPRGEAVIGLALVRYRRDVLMDDPEEIFVRLQEEVLKNSDVLGFFLGGSRGKGLVTMHSDYDIYVVVKDGLVGPFTETLQRDLPVTEAYTWIGDESEKVSMGDFGSIVVFSLSGFER
ncbi:MAG: nucleotidyltransferase domain-containing protein, partial [Candidatus Geothermarchaeales archaeon]